eukprot:TRINITY_DN28682_c0_g1_i1.p1 TRINITY_DN28682_c0_g1~~TRINITY_DN28682_c0_g1_i1.p1  ORF type:complete len:899 (+),score=79.36 TRINITY_DN28682_c0_g1_i1:79-2775(+)
MCSFLLANWLLESYLYLNRYMQRRGPDSTRVRTFGQWYFLHNLLSISGMPGFGSEQPYMLESRGLAGLYNGEIYNHAMLPPYEGSQVPYGASDGEVLLPSFLKHGTNFVRMLDGEFALGVVDALNGLVVLAVDIFGTKPLWYGVSSRKPLFAAASYKSVLVSLGVYEPGEIRAVPPNTALVFSIHSDKPAELLRQFHVVEFDMRQFKSHTFDWESAFTRAVRKRSEQSRHAFWIGLGSGYDSGAVHCALKNMEPTLHLLELGYAAWCMHAQEKLDVLRARLQHDSKSSIPHSSYIVLLGRHEYKQHKTLLDEFAEPVNGSSVSEDPAAVGLSYLCQEARDRNQLVHLSGTGADETISDYGHLGPEADHGLGDSEKRNRHSEPFPDDLLNVFPWRNFYLGTMRRFITKEEVVLGAHGIEARYPFLDREVIQEYLWLSVDAKNRIYKAPIHSYLQKYSYAFDQGKKLGFAAASNMQPKTVSVGPLRGAVDDDMLWNSLLDKASASCWGPQLHVADMSSQLEQLASELRDPCKLLMDVTSSSLRSVLSWAGLRRDSDRQVASFSSECAPNEVGLRFAAASLLTPSALQWLVSTEGQGKALYLGEELDWLLSLDWIALANTRRLRMLLELVARAAESASSRIQMDTGVTNGCGGDVSLFSLQAELTAKWNLLKENRAMEQGMRLPLALLALVQARMWRFLDEVDCARSRILDVAPESPLPGFCTPSTNIRFHNWHPSTLQTVARPGYRIHGLPPGHAFSLKMQMSEENTSICVNGDRFHWKPLSFEVVEAQAVVAAPWGHLDISLSFDNPLTLKSLPCQILENTTFVKAQELVLPQSWRDQQMTLEECCALCYEQGNCIGWTYHMQRYTCRMYEEVGLLQPHHALHFGRVRYMARVLPPDLS